MPQMLMPMKSSAWTFTETGARNRARKDERRRPLSPGSVCSIAHARRPQFAKMARAHFTMKHPPTWVVARIRDEKERKVTRAPSWIPWWFAGNSQAIGTRYLQQTCIHRHERIRAAAAHAAADGCV